MNNVVIKRSAKACWTLFRLRLTEGLQYRLAALSNVSIGAFWALIEIVVYTVFYTYSDGSAESINGLSLAQAVSYVWIAQMMVALTPMRVDADVLEMIQNGNVGLELCRPLDLYFHWFAKSAATRISGFWLRGLGLTLVGLVVPASIRLTLPQSTLGFVAFVLSLFSAMLLCTAYGMLINTVRLGLTWGDGPTYIMMLLGGVLSGSYLPLQLWPDVLQRFLLAQPFAGYLDIPARLYVGSLPPEQGLSVIALQWIWTAIFIALGRWLMRFKLRHIIVQGG